jgi:hypothetical protein
VLGRCFAVSCCAMGSAHGTGTSWARPRAEPVPAPHGHVIVERASAVEKMVRLERLAAVRAASAVEASEERHAGLRVVAEPQEVHPAAARHTRPPPALREVLHELRVGHVGDMLCHGWDAFCLLADGECHVSRAYIISRAGDACVRHGRHVGALTDKRRSVRSPLACAPPARQAPPPRQQPLRQSPRS